MRGQTASSCNNARCYNDNAAESVPKSEVGARGRLFFPPSRVVGHFALRELSTLYETGHRRTDSTEMAVTEECM